MSDRGEHLTVSEFERSQKALERALASGFDRMERRFDAVDDVQKTHGERLAVLEAAKRADQKKSVAWTSAVATVVVGVIEGLRSLASR